MPNPKFMVGMKRHRILPIGVIEIISLEQRDLSDEEKASIISIAVTSIEIAEKIYEGKPDEDYKPENNLDFDSTRVSFAIKFKTMKGLKECFELIKTIISL